MKREIHKLSRGMSVGYGLVDGVDASPPTASQCANVMFVEAIT
ncbi:hypothetical protein SL1157_0794 [Ruegeria lacuscaerulensis ITI-1157]|nr:hypothetical protein SL1157_0794 [Ruegeria lacuscaerulensis ITI-1157]